MSKEYQITEGVFYITNVCNLTCTYCMTYNDKVFKGHFRWDDYSNDYEKWSTFLSMDRITILGGEPFANSDLLNWVTGIRKLWPEVSDINVCTNGTYLEKNFELVEKIITNNVWLDVCVHDPELYSHTEQNLESILKQFNFKKVTVKNHDIGYHSFNVTEYYSGEKLLAKLSEQWNFSSNSTKEIREGVIYMHTSDPETAHSNCAAKFCHYFVKGKLHKCFLTGVSLELVNQFKIDAISKSLLEKYQACSPWDNKEDITNFINGIEHYLPQCSLCPEKKSSYPIWPLAAVKVKV